jgi:hypothetical protein
MSLVTLNRTSTVSDAQQYRMMYAATFPAFLIAAVASRLWWSGGSRKDRAVRSIWAEARAASAKALLFAFQG